MYLTKPQFFYHITDENWGKKKKLVPRDNDHPNVCNRCEEEPNTPRICVCPTVAKCLSAVELSGNVRIYRTYRPCRAHYPRRVSDSRITKERWLFRPTVFVRVGSLSHWLIRIMADKMDGFCFGGYGIDLERQKTYYAWVCANLISLMDKDSCSSVKSGVSLV